MITIYFADVNKMFAVRDYEATLSQLPQSLIDRINQYTGDHERKQRLAGKLLLKQLLSDTKATNSITDIQFRATNKPFFPDSALHFSIAHSGDITVCAMADSPVGIDIEKVTDIPLSPYKGQFSGDEWTSIDSSTQPIEQFFKYWTRKEALLKATGQGIFTPFANVPVINDQAIFEEKTWYLSALSLTSGYIAHIASEQSGATFEIKELL